MTRTAWIIAITSLVALAGAGAVVSLTSTQTTETAAPKRVPVVTVSRVVPPASLKEAMSMTEGRVAQISRDEARCLSQAVYFEARSEPLEGQLAVAQVVLNRVESPYWPNTICGVVFQNERMRHRCQFSFACDGLTDSPYNRRAWRTAETIAAVALHDLWDDVTDGATHYHADYVQPDWRKMMHPTVAYGRHQFYRDWRHATLVQAAITSTGS